MSAGQNRWVPTEDVLLWERSHKLLPILRGELSEIRNELESARRERAALEEKAAQDVNRLRRLAYLMAALGTVLGWAITEALRHA